MTQTYLEMSTQVKEKKSLLPMMKNPQIKRVTRMKIQKKIYLKRIMKTPAADAPVTRKIKIRSQKMTRKTKTQTIQSQRRKIKMGKGVKKIGLRKTRKMALRVRTRLKMVNQRTKIRKA
jgi:hypothetical protein